MTVQIYHWRAAEVLKRWGYGDIVVAAESVEQARDIARQSFITFVKDGEQCEFSVDEYAFGDEEANKEAWSKAIARLEADIATEPQVCNAVFVWGSA